MGDDVGATVTGGGRCQSNGSRRGTKSKQQWPVGLGFEKGRVREIGDDVGAAMTSRRRYPEYWQMVGMMLE